MKEVFYELDDLFEHEVVPRFKSMLILEQVVLYLHEALGKLSE
jgi:hypothetical protein